MASHASTIQHYKAMHHSWDYYTSWDGHLRLRAKGKIALATYFCNIAEVPLDLPAVDVPICGSGQGTALCTVIQETKAIVVDEALMTIGLHLRL